MAETMPRLRIDFGRGMHRECRSNGKLTLVTIVDWKDLSAVGSWPSAEEWWWKSRVAGLLLTWLWWWWRWSREWREALRARWRVVRKTVVIRRKDAMWLPKALRLGWKARLVGEAVVRWWKRWLLVAREARVVGWETWLIGQTLLIVERRLVWRETLAWLVLEARLSRVLEALLRRVEARLVEVWSNWSLWLLRSA